MTDTELDAVRQVMNHGQEESEEVIRVHIGKWFYSINGQAAFDKAVKAGALIRGKETDHKGRKMWRLNDG